MSQLDAEEMDNAECSFCGWQDGEHAPGCPHDNPLCYTQGGGTAKWDELNGCYVFVRPAPGFDFQEGDFVPEE